MIEQTTAFFEIAATATGKQSKRKRVNVITLNGKLLVCNARTIDGKQHQHRDDVTTISDKVFQQLRERYPHKQRYNAKKDTFTTVYSLKKTTRPYKGYPVGTLYLSNSCKPLRKPEPTELDAGGYHRNWEK